MKIVITLSEETVTKSKYVVRVGTVNQLINGKLKTEQDVLDAIKKYNDEQGFERYVVRDVDDVVAEAFAFLLGEKGYKTTYDIEDIYDRACEVQNAIESLSTDVYDIEEAVRVIKEKVEKLKPAEEE